jgi:hypothetical protein
MFMGMAPIGSLLAGGVADRFGAPVTVAAGGIICMAAASVFSIHLPGIRTEARRLVVAQQMAAGNPPQQMTGGNLEMTD